MPTSSSDQTMDKFFKNINVADIIEPEAYHKCIRLMPFVLDEEASPEESEYFHQCIKNWPWVIEYYETEKALRAAIRAKLAYMAVPLGLADAIKQKIREV